MLEPVKNELEMIKEEEKEQECSIIGQLLGAQPLEKESEPSKK